MECLNNQKHTHLSRKNEVGSNEGWLCTEEGPEAWDGVQRRNLGYFYKKMHLRNAPGWRLYVPSTTHCRLGSGHGELVEKNVLYSSL